MNAIDTAKGYMKLYELRTHKDWWPGHQSHEEAYGVIKGIAEEVGVRVDTIHEYLQMLNEPAYVVEDLLAGRPRTYREVYGVPKQSGCVRQLLLPSRHI